MAARTALLLSHDHRPIHIHLAALIRLHVFFANLYFHLQLASAHLPTPFSSSDALGDWMPARATYYAAVEPRETVAGACGYGDLRRSGYGLAGTVAVSEALFERGQACGACLQVRCAGELRYCIAGASVKLTVTNFCPPNYGLAPDAGGHCNAPNRHLVMPIQAFEKIAMWNAGSVLVQYRRITLPSTILASGAAARRHAASCSGPFVLLASRVSSRRVCECSFLRALMASCCRLVAACTCRTRCIRDGGIRFTMDGYGVFHTVLVSNVAGTGDVVAVKVKGSRTAWLPMGRNWGQNWHVNADLKGQSLSFEVTTSDGATVTSYAVAPGDWSFRQTYVGKQFQM